MSEALNFALNDLKNTLSNAMNTQVASEFPSFRRDLELHPSGFPYCPLRTLHEFLNKDYSPTGETTFSGSYFTSVGTLVHTLIQRFMGMSGRVWGHWHCRNENCSYKTKKISKYHECPDCGSQLEYDEIGYMLGGTLSGHQDCLFEDSNGNFWVVDYKTCLLSKAMKHAANGKELAGNNTYRAQQETYVALCQKRFKKFFEKQGIKFSVKGYILVYMPRDIPFQFQFVANEVPPERKKEVWETICRNIEEHNAILDAESFSDIEHLIADKPCKSIEDYRNNMASPYSECPLLGVCFREKQLKGYIKEEMNDSLALPLRKTIHIAIEEQKKVNGVLK